jgi:hypothetical protein
MFIEMFNRKKKEIAKLLHLLFKVNFLMVTFGNKKASVFISSIITPVKEIKKTNKNVDLYDKVIQFLNDKLDEIYINNNYFKNFNIDAYSYTNNKDVVDLINIYAQNYDESTQTIDFGKISPILLELSTDHLIPKTKPYYFEKIVDILKSGKKKKKTIKHPIYSVQQQNNKKIVSYDQEIFRNCEKTLSLKQGMDKDDFMNKVIHKPFNLRNVSKSHNSRKQNKLAYTKEQLCDIMADSKINERIKKYNDFFHFFIFDKLPLHKSDNKSPID